MYKPDLFVNLDYFVFLIGNNTAVRLRGDYRLHDYINANEIKVIIKYAFFLSKQSCFRDYILINNILLVKVHYKILAEIFGR